MANFSVVVVTFVVTSALQVERTFCRFAIKCLSCPADAIANDSTPSGPVNAPPTGAEGLSTIANSAVPRAMIAAREEIICATGPVPPRIGGLEILGEA
jgi:hypothetical protein